MESSKQNDGAEDTESDSSKTPFLFFQNFSSGTLTVEGSKLKLQFLLNLNVSSSIS